MELIGRGITTAFEMLRSGDAELWRITLLTLRVSSMATLISVLLGVPVGVLLALTRFPGRGLLISLVNTLMGLPPVVAGLAVSILLWRSGPLGHLRLIYTPTAILIADCVIAIPIVIGLTLSGIQQLNQRLQLQILALGASRWQLFWILIREARLSILSTIIVAFGRVSAEVGAAMMVGGNLMGRTRVLTTATVMEVNKGNFDVAIALAVILLSLAWLVTLALTLVQQRGRNL